MQLQLIVSQTHLRDADSQTVTRELLELAKGAEDAALDGLAVNHSWLAYPVIGLQAIPLAAWLSAYSDLPMMVNHLALSIMNPVELAENLVTLDHATSGKVSASVTPNVAEEQMATFGIDPASGLSRFEEGLDILDKMWTTKEFSHQTGNYNIPPVNPTLYPVQVGGPPLAVTAVSASDATLAVKHGLGICVPTTVPNDSCADIVRSLRRDSNATVVVQRLCATDEDHDAARIRFMSGFASESAPMDEMLEAAMVGGPGDVRQHVATLLEAGVDVLAIQPKGVGTAVAEALDAAHTVRSAIGGS